jgi:hypothetical protein
MNGIKEIANEISSKFKIEVDILDECNLGVNDNKYILKIDKQQYIENNIVKIVYFITEMDNVYSVDYKMGSEYLYEIEIILEN